MTAHSPHLMANRRFAILSLIGDGKLGPALMRAVSEAWPTPIGRKAFGCEIAKLQHAGLVRSYAGKTRDGRSSLYKVTPEGREFITEHLAVLDAFVRAGKRANGDTVSHQVPDMHGMSVGLVFLRKRAEHAAEGPIRDALNAAADHMERMQSELRVGV